MLLKIARLLSPAAAEGGAAVAEEDPSAMAGWMADLPALETPETQPPKKTDGTSNAKPGGTGGAGVPAGAKSGDKGNEDAAARDAAARAADESARAAALQNADKSKADTAAKEKAEKEKVEADKKAAEEAEKAKPAEDKWPRSSSDWERYKKVHAEKEGKLQAQIEAGSKELETVKAQLKTVEEQAKEQANANNEPAPEIKASLDRLTKENEEMSRRLMVLDVTQHPKFQNYFNSKVEGQKTLGKNIVGQEKAPAFEKLLSLPDGEYKNAQLEEFVADLPTLQQSRIGAVLNALDDINRERESEIVKAGQHRETLTTEQKAKTVQNIAARDKLINDTLASLQAENGFSTVFKTKAGDDAHNKAVNERIATVKAVLSGQGVKPAEIVRAAFLSQAVTPILEAYKADMTEKDDTITKLEAQVKALTAAQPAGGAGGAAAGGDTTTVLPRPKLGQTPGEAMDSWTSGMWQET